MHHGKALEMITYGCAHLFHSFSSYDPPWHISLYVKTKKTESGICREDGPEWHVSWGQLELLLPWHTSGWSAYCWLHRIRMNHWSLWSRTIRMPLRNDNKKNQNLPVKIIPLNKVCCDCKEELCILTVHLRFMGFVALFFIFYLHLEKARSCNQYELCIEVMLASIRKVSGLRINLPTFFHRLGKPQILVLKKGHRSYTFYHSFPLNGIPGPLSS